MGTGFAGPAQSAGDRPFGQKLSVRQLECLSLAAEHLTSKEIALRLGISSHTVDQYFRRSIRALRARDRRDAVRLLRKARAADERNGASEPEPLPLADIPLPFATARRPYNTMSWGFRVAWIAAIGIFASAGAAMYLAGLESLARMLRVTH
jgi:DNA-binding CsgD family transcriptional regulator